MVTGVSGKGEESDQPDYRSNSEHAEVQRRPGDGAGKGAAGHAEASHTCEQGPARRGRCERKAREQVEHQCRLLLTSGRSVLF